LQLNDFRGTLREGLPEGRLEIRGGKFRGRRRGFSGGYYTEAPGLVIHFAPLDGISGLLPRIREDERRERLSRGLIIVTKSGIRLEKDKELSGIGEDSRPCSLSEPTYFSGRRF